MGAAGAGGRTVVLLGATGLVGRECLRQLEADPDVGGITVLARRPLEARSPKTRVVVLDFDKLASRSEVFAVDQVFCALGTTIRQAGSQEVFRRVDFDYSREAALLGQRQGARHFLLVSALGASSTSRIFYNRVKGELEDALRTMQYRSVTIVRPSLLLGQRTKPRLGEELGKRLGWLAPGKYKPVQASDVARVLVQSARQDEPGLHIIESDEIRLLSSGVA
ncbi:MAG TPA: NAD(P)H-binding protein [Gemmatimonadaceae bacterium]|jgi:uncharacterized protein YbjT (DUF2867 family)|nr:NAD(P)H-binding protein [Gemmatimonadaceae bacterium]